MEIRQVHPLFVGEVNRIDLGQSIDAPAVRAIWQAIDRYAVVVFHDQHFNDRELRDFARQFGELEIGRSAARGGEFPGCSRLEHPPISVAHCPSPRPSSRNRGEGGTRKAGG